VLAGPYELANIIDHPAAADTLEMMKARLETLRRETGAGTVPQERS